MQKKKKPRIPTPLQLDVKIYSHKLARQGYTVEQIGQILGKHHSTITYNKSICEDYLSVDRRFRERYEQFDEADFVQRFTQYQHQLSTATA